MVKYDQGDWDDPGAASPATTGMEKRPDDSGGLGYTAQAPEPGRGARGKKQQPIRHW